MEKGRIGLNAGKVWHALNEVNEISTQELSRKLSLSIEDLALAIGWLARENNIYITRKNGLLYVSNGIKSNMSNQNETKKGYPSRTANLNC